MLSLSSLPSPTNEAVRFRREASDQSSTSTISSSASHTLGVPVGVIGYPSLGALLPADGEAAGGETDDHEHHEVHDERDDTDVRVRDRAGQEGEELAYGRLLDGHVGDGQDAGDDAGGSPPLGHEVVGHEGEEQSGEELGYEAVPEEEQEDYPLAALQGEPEGHGRDDRDEHLGYGDDPLLAGRGREHAVDILGEHCRGHHQEHRTGDQGGEEAGGA